MIFQMAMSIRSSSHSTISGDSFAAPTPPAAGARVSTSRRSQSASGNTKGGASSAGSSMVSDLDFSQAILLLGASGRAVQPRRAVQAEVAGRGKITLASL
jgi:hypothetical protein